MIGQAVSQTNISMFSPFLKTGQSELHMGLFDLKTSRRKLNKTLLWNFANFGEVALEEMSLQKKYWKRTTATYIHNYLTLKHYVPGWANDTWNMHSSIYFANVMFTSSQLCYGFTVYKTVKYRIFKINTFRLKRLIFFLLK